MSHYDASNESWKVRNFKRTEGEAAPFYPGVDRTAFASCGVVVKHSDSTAKSEVIVLAVAQHRGVLGAADCVRVRAGVARERGQCVHAGVGGVLHLG
jgi:hypothetical protein